MAYKVCSENLWSNNACYAVSHLLSYCTLPLWEVRRSYLGQLGAKHPTFANKKGIYRGQILKSALLWGRGEVRDLGLWLRSLHFTLACRSDGSPEKWIKQKMYSNIVIDNPFCSAHVWAIHSSNWAPFYTWANVANEKIKEWKETLKNLQKTWKHWNIDFS